MDIRRYKDILALKTEENRVIGFHAFNMTVAELTPELWGALEHPKAIPDEIRAELEAWNNELDAATTDAPAFEKIRSLSLNVAQICNLACTYCAAGGDGTYGSSVTKIDTTKAEVQIKHFLLAAKPGEHFEIKFLGGEPLLYPQIVESLCNYANLCVAGRDMQLDFSITTNGTRITLGVAQMFAQNKFNVTVSFDGPMNDRFRPTKASNQSSTKMTLAGLNNLAPVREQLGSLKVNCVFGVHNTAVVETYSYLNLLGVEWDVMNLNFANTVSSLVDEAAEAEATEIYLAEMRELAQYLYEEAGLEGLAKIAQFRRPLVRLASQSRVNSYCGAGKALVLTDTRGDLYACNWFMNDEKEKVGHLTHIDEKKWQHYQPELIALNKCESCWARHMCGGGCMAVNKGYSGNKHEKNPYFCKRTRELAALAIKYFTANEAVGRQNEAH